VLCYIFKAECLYLTRVVYLALRIPHSLNSIHPSTRVRMEEQALLLANCCWLCVEECSIYI